jgi:hypothetical protein
LSLAFGIVIGACSRSAVISQTALADCC